MSHQSGLKQASHWKRHLGAAMLMAALSTQALAADPVLSISATPNPVVQGSTVSVDVLISGISDLYGYQFSLSFDPTILQASGVSEGSFLSSGGNTFGGTGTINNSLGSIEMVFNTLIGPVPGVSGNGTLAQISFNVTGAGSSALNFSNAIFVDPNIADLPLQIQNGSLQALPVPEPASYLMLLGGLAALGGMRLRSKRLVSEQTV